MDIGILGSGHVAQNLGKLLLDNGYQVTLSSRSDKKVEGFEVTNFIEIARKSELVIIAVPFTVVKDVLTPLAELLGNKTVIDATNPLGGDWSPIILGGENSAGEEISRILPAAKVVKAFNSIFADVMYTDKQTFSGQKLTAFIAADDRTSLKQVSKIVEDIGFEPVTVVGIKNARYLEAMAHININIALSGGGTDAGFKYYQR